MIVTCNKIHSGEKLANQNEAGHKLIKESTLYPELQKLSGFVTENRLKRIEEVLQVRTRHLTVVLEDIYLPHNVAAVLRSCDCFGIQDVHIIENRNQTEPDPFVELSASKWLTVHKYNSLEENTADAFASLKKNGYRIVVASPHKNDCTIEDLDITKKTALVFGMELPGASPAAFARAEGFVKIPMVGFTESLNISVSAAVSLYILTSRLRKSSIDWKLSEEEKAEIRLQWVRNTVRKRELLDKSFFKKGAR
jgi:tRNA (guanosine-2'-O-)-methyltransferase